jgi:hypothetical protein
MATILTTTYDSVTDTTALTITLASLATSSGLLVGRESTAITNVSNLYVDAMLSGQIMTGTTPTVNTNIEVWLYGVTKHVASTPTYQSPVTGTDAAITFVAETKLKQLVASWTVNATSNTAYSFSGVSVAALCGGIMPIKWGVVVIHSTVAALHATAGNHWIMYQGIKYTNT